MAFGNKLIEERNENIHKQIETLTYEIVQLTSAASQESNHSDSIQPVRYFSNSVEAETVQPESQLHESLELVENLKRELEASRIGRLLQG